jgi:hypothetical protein
VLLMSKFLIVICSTNLDVGNCNEGCYNVRAGCISKCCPQMKFLDISLTKDLSLLLNAIYSLSAADF